MAKVIKKLKMKKPDETMSDYIPIGAEAENINVDGESVEIKLDKKPYYYNTVADMKADTKLKAGDMAITLGYYEANDGGASEYYITNTAPEDLSYDVYEKLNNNCYANTMIDNYIRVSQFGAKGDGVTDDTDALQRVFNYAQNGKTVVFENNKTYMVDPSKNYTVCNGDSVIRKRYAALILKGYNINIIGNGATIKAIVTQSDYDNSNPNFGAVINISAARHSEDKINTGNNQIFEKQIGQRITIHNLNIDGGSTSVTKVFHQFNLSAGQGICVLNQDRLYLEISGGSIKNTFAEGMTGGGENTTIIYRGVSFANSYPSCANISGKYELIDGCTFDNCYAIEMNPSYKDGTQIVQNCYFKHHYIANEYQLIFNCISGCGLLSADPENNSSIVIKNNIFDLEYDLNPATGTFTFYKIKDFRFEDNTIYIKANNDYISGYGGIFELGRMNNLVLKDNYIGINYVESIKGKELIRYRRNENIDKSIIENNTFEILNRINFSGTTYSGASSESGKINGFKTIIHFTVSANNSNYVYRLMGMDIFTSVKIKSSRYVSLSIFDIKGFNASSGFTSLLENGAQSITLSPEGRIINITCIEKHSTGRNLYITGQSLDSDLDLDMEFI